MQFFKILIDNIKSHLISNIDGKCVNGFDFLNFELKNCHKSSLYGWVGGLEKYFV